VNPLAGEPPGRSTPWPVNPQLTYYLWWRLKNQRFDAGFLFAASDTF